MTSCFYEGPHPAFVMIAAILWTLSLGLLATVEGKSGVSCPHDFVLVGKKCYFFSTERQTWQEAYWKCLSANSTLAVISKAEQDDLLRNYLNKHKLGKTNSRVRQIRLQNLCHLLKVSTSGGSVEFMIGNSWSGNGEFPRSLWSIWGSPGTKGRIRICSGIVLRLILSSRTGKRFISLHYPSDISYK